MRKCLSHLGQTLRLSSRSFFQMNWRQLSHFTHRPSVRTLRSPAVSSAPDWLLIYAMEGSFLLMVVGWWLTSPQSSAKLSVIFQFRAGAKGARDKSQQLKANSQQPTANSQQLSQYSIPFCARTPFS